MTERNEGTKGWSGSSRPLVKCAYAEEFIGAPERRTGAYSNVREDSSTEATHKLPAEVAFLKRSIVRDGISLPLLLNLMYLADDRLP